MAESGNTTNNFVRLWQWLTAEMKKPVGHVGFWCYFVVVVIIVGGLGIWISLFRDKTLLSVVGSLLTYFPAIAAASCFELIHSERQPKFARNVAIFSAALLAIAAIVISANVAGYATALVGTLASAFALGLWWLANANNPTLRDDALAPSGGDSSASPAGSSGGFQL
jgi:hypothetical protein